MALTETSGHDAGEDDLEECGGKHCDGFA